MKYQVANYTVVIEKQKRLGTDRDCYVAYIPVLGIATDADRLEEVEKEIKSLIQFHLESLAEEGEEIPLETEPTFITRSQVNLPKRVVLA